MVQRTVDVVEEHGNLQIPSGQNLSDYVRAILKADAKSYTPLASFFERHRSFFQFDLRRDGVDDRPPDHAELIVEAYRRLHDISPSNWTKEKIHDQLDLICSSRKQSGIEATENETPSEARKISKDLMNALRKTVMASRPGPSMADCMQILGRKTTLERLSRAVPGSSTVQQTPPLEYASNAA